MSNNPFCRKEFLQALIESECVGPDKGWDPIEFNSGPSKLTTFAKSHSYGEYIFDWGWAEAYEKVGIPYYPKLTSMVPFTPVTSRHFLDANEKVASGLLQAHDKWLGESSFSGAHFLFLEQDERKLLTSHQYMIRESLQYHFFNEGYSDFENFLQSLRTKKAKNILKERSLSGIKIRRITSGELKEVHADRMYKFYISTIEKKHSFDYLNQDFFRRIFRSMKENILYIEAEKDEEFIGGSLFFYDDQKLYGRYWGTSTYVENLHFELCYYQGIDFCLERKLRVFEAGAQGEHKISRGFRPTIIYSAHKIKHPGFSAAIREFIDDEKSWVQLQKNELSKLLPFKSSIRQDP